MARGRTADGVVAHEDEREGAITMGAVYLERSGQSMLVSCLCVGLRNRDGSEGGLPVVAPSSRRPRRRGVRPRLGCGGGALEGRLKFDRVTFFSWSGFAAAATVDGSGDDMPGVRVTRRLRWQLEHRHAHQLRA